ncbi:LysR substrate-binding domain-containing protein, partial [Streptomyces mesophilus]|uniref:LysR substrate-binding domain-containing protein n=1 Tax=Streptomyces mesophilus TaxID=1775132 RepID=UPI003323C06E
TGRRRGRVHPVPPRRRSAQGLQPSIALQAGAADAIAELAARGLGVAVLSESMAHGYRDRLVIHRVADARTPALLALVWKNGHHPPVREVLKDCRRAFKGAGPA